MCHQSFSVRCRCVFVGRCVNAANVNSLYSASGTKTSERYMFLILNSRQISQCLNVKWNMKSPSFLLGTLMLKFNKVKKHIYSLVHKTVLASVDNFLLPNKFMGWDFFTLIIRSASRSPLRSDWCKFHHRVWVQRSVLLFAWMAIFLWVYGLVCIDFALQHISGTYAEGRRLQRNRTRIEQQNLAVTSPGVCVFIHSRV